MPLYFSDNLLRTDRKSKYILPRLRLGQCKLAQVEQKWSQGGANTCEGIGSFSQEGGKSVHEDQASSPGDVETLQRSTEICSQLAAISDQKANSFTASGVAVFGSEALAADSKLAARRKQDFSGKQRGFTQHQRHGGR